MNVMLYVMQNNMLNAMLYMMQNVRYLNWIVEHVPWREYLYSAFFYYIGVVEYRRFHLVAFLAITSHIFHLLNTCLHGVLLTNRSHCVSESIDLRILRRIIIII